MSSLAQQIALAAVASVVRKRSPGKPPEVYAAERAQVREEYRALFGDRHLTTSQVAAARGISYGGCKTMLLRLEREGLIRRTGTADHKGNGPRAIVWAFVL